jgi:hypothetical protein
MDPNANLERQERILIEIANTPGADQRRTLSEDLIELRSDLTHWLSVGGFAPQWERWPIAAHYYTRPTR